MTDVEPIILDPVFSEDEAAHLLELRSAYGQYRFTLGAQARYFRETYLYGGNVFLPGIEFVVEHPTLADAARRLHGREVIVPAIVYANILVPGQRLEVHTDLPEYRGADRRSVPQWLLLVMQHSGLFEQWRLPIATAITYVGGGRGGSFDYYPAGPAGPMRSFHPHHNTALLMDVDAIYHGVGEVQGDGAAAGTFRPGVRIEPTDAGRWAVRSANGATTIAEYAADDLRYSVSWKAYCFVDQAEQTTWQDHTNDLDLDTIKRLMLADLDRNGSLPGGEQPATDGEFRKLVEAAYGATSWRDIELGRMGLG